MMHYFVWVHYHWWTSILKIQKMNKDAKIYIAGHNGMVGSAIWRTLNFKGYTNLIGASSKELT
jgi:hypothetical protein